MKRNWHLGRLKEKQPITGRVKCIYILKNSAGRGALFLFFLPFFSLLSKKSLHHWEQSKGTIKNTARTIPFSLLHLPPLSPTLSPVFLF